MLSYIPRHHLIAGSFMKIPLRHWLLCFTIALGTALLAGCGTPFAISSYEDDLAFQASDSVLGQDKFQITIDKTRFFGGRDGELWQIFKRRAAYIVQREGCSSYTVLEYTEGNEATVVAGNRVGRGTIECNKAADGKS